MTGDVSWVALGVVASVMGLIIAGVFAVMMFLFKVVASLREDHASLRVEVAQKYVENKTLERVEERLEKSITTLGDRLETALRAVFIHYKGD